MTDSPSNTFLTGQRHAQLPSIKVLLYSLQKNRNCCTVFMYGFESLILENKL